MDLETFIDNARTRICILKPIFYYKYAYFYVSNSDSAIVILETLTFSVCFSTNILL